MFSAIRMGSLAIAVGASLVAASVLGSGSAEARVPVGDRVSDSAINCGNYQDDFDRAWRDYNNPNASEWEKERALMTLRAAVSEWVDGPDNCQDSYGSIYSRVAPTTNAATHGTVGATNLAVEPAPVAPNTKQPVSNTRPVNRK